MTANESENPDCEFYSVTMYYHDIDCFIVFWALRGGGAGSWGVIISTTFRTFPTFEAVLHQLSITVPTNASTGALAEVHARHIFDFDEARAGQYFSFFAGGSEGNLLTLATYFPNSTKEKAKSLMKPFLDDVRAINASISPEVVTVGSANDFMFENDTSFGINDILGSRLIPMEAYKNNAKGIGEGVQTLMEMGVEELLGHNLLGGELQCCRVTCVLS